MNTNYNSLDSIYEAAYRLKGQLDDFDNQAKATKTVDLTGTSKSSKKDTKIIQKMMDAYIVAGELLVKMSSELRELKGGFEHITKTVDSKSEYEKVESMLSSIDNKLQRASKEHFKIFGGDRD